MPINAAINSWSLTNLGPLTTTFTAAPSCSTQYNHVIIGTNATVFDTHSVILDPIGSLCGSPAPIGDCLPSASALARQQSHSGAPGPAAVVDYYSPGLVCPSGYRTVGLATKLDGGSAASSGAAFVYPSPTPTGGVGAVQYSDLGDLGPNVLLEAMGAGETAVLCCPSGFDANFNGRCSSTLPADYPIPSSVCERWYNPDDVVRTNVTITAFGGTLSGQGFSVVETASPSTSTVSLGTSDLIGTAAGDYVAVSVQQVLYLVHAASDTALAPATGTAGSTASSAAASTPQWAGLTFTGLLFTLVAAFTSGFMLILS